MTTIKVSKETHKELIKLKGKLMSTYEQDFTFDEIITAMLEHLVHTLVDDVPYTLEPFLALKWPVGKRDKGLTE